MPITPETAAFLASFFRDGLGPTHGELELAFAQAGASRYLPRSGSKLSRALAGLNVLSNGGADPENGDDLPADDGKLGGVAVFLASTLVAKGLLAPEDAQERLSRDGLSLQGEKKTSGAGQSPALNIASNPGTEHERAQPMRDLKRVMVVHGRNVAARDAMFAFLYAIGLRPISWNEAVSATKRATPHTLDAVLVALDGAGAVVVILTAEDEARLLPRLRTNSDGPSESELRGQPRPNVFLEAGMALAQRRDATVLVEIGPLRGVSDLAGLNVIRLTNEAPSRFSLLQRFKVAGCETDEASGEWMNPDVAGNFEAALRHPEPDASEETLAISEAREPRISDAQVAQLLSMYRSIDQPMTLTSVRSAFPDSSPATIANLLAGLEGDGRIRPSDSGEGWEPVE